MAMFTRTELKQEARQVLRLQTTPFVLATLIIFAITGALSGVQSSVTNNAGEPTFISLFITLVSVFVSGLFSFSFASMSLKTLSNKKITAGNAFDGYERLNSNVGVLLLMWVKTFLWSLLFIIPGIIAAYRYSMSLYIILENPDMGANAALAESSRIMNGHKWEYFVLQLSFILWALLGVVTFGIALLWVTPYMELTYAAFYNRIKPQVVAEGAMNDATAGQRIMTEEEAREAINAVMNRNADAPVIDEEVAEVPAEAAPVVEVEPEQETAAEETPVVEEKSADEKPAE